MRGSLRSIPAATNLRGARRSLQLALAMAALCSAAEASDVRGAMAFHYGRLTPEQVEAYSRFKILVTHDPLPPQQAALLRSRGTKLVLYEWAVGFYRSLVKPSSWEQQLLASSSQTLLHRNALKGHLASPTADAYYYDPATPEHTNGRAKALAAKVKAIGYDGIFFDLTTSESVHPTALNEYRKRHPELPFDVAFRRFMQRLRAELGSGLIVTNQAYRSAENYLPFADWDVTESLITRPQQGRFKLRLWHDRADLWNSISHLFQELILPARKRYPRVKFLHLNYLDKLQPDEISSIVGIARLFGDDAFVTTPDLEPRGGEMNDVYFVSLGAPATPVVTTNDGAAAYRWFSRGFIGVNASTTPVLLTTRRQNLIRLPTGEPVRRRVQMEPSRDGTPRVTILGRR